MCDKTQSTLSALHLLHVYLLCWSPHRLQLPVEGETQNL